MKARIINGIVGEILTPIDGFSIEDCFHPQLIAMCVDVADEVQVGWVQQEDGSFAAPVVVAPVEEAPVETPTETPTEPV